MSRDTDELNAVILLLSENDQSGTNGIRTQIALLRYAAKHLSDFGSPVGIRESMRICFNFLEKESAERNPGESFSRDQETIQYSRGAWHSAEITGRRAAANPLKILGECIGVLESRVLAADVNKISPDAARAADANGANAGTIAATAQGAAKTTGNFDPGVSGGGAGAGR